MPKVFHNGKEWDVVDGELVATVPASHVAQATETVTRHQLLRELRSVSSQIKKATEEKEVIRQKIIALHTAKRGLTTLLDAVKE
jgi:hypothetical protein